MNALLNSDSPARLSLELREANHPHVENRRRITGLSLVAAGALGMVALYQMGIIKRIPEPPLPGFDAEKVDASPEAYEKLSTPDAVLGIASYGATMTLAAMGGADRARTAPLVPLALAAKLTFDAVQAARLTVDQWTKHRAFCFWCLAASAATFAALPLVVPEARAALFRLQKSEDIV